MKTLKRLLNIRYALSELVLITLGVSIALVVQNWNERRKEKDFEMKILKELLSSIEADISSLNFIIKEDEKTKRGIDSLLTLLENDVAYEPSIDTLIGRSFWTIEFYPRTHSYETLRSVGMTLIENDSLRIGIASLYGQAYAHKASITDWGEPFWEETIPFGIKNFKQFDLKGMTPRDFNSLKKNEEFKTILRSLKYFRRVDIFNSKKALKRSEEVAASIEEFLRKG